MTTKKTEYTLQDLGTDEQVHSIMEKLQNSIMELATVITQKIVYNIFENINVSVPVKTAPATAKKITQTQPTARTKRTIDWSQKTDSAVYSALNHRRNKNQDIEPELLAEIQKRFPTYNPETKSITRRNTKLTDWPNMTKQQLRTALNNRRAKGAPIDPALITELQKHFSNFNPATLTFTRKKKTRTDWSNTSKPNLRAAYHYRLRHNMPIEPELNAALSVAFSGYDNTTQKFTGKREKRKTNQKQDQTTKPMVIAQTTKTIVKKQSQPIAQKCDVAKKTNNEIPVYIKYVKSDLHGAYNDVYINGTKILSNHYDTEIKLLLDNTLLAIHGIITDNRNFPQKPIWQIYDTSLRSRISLQKQKFSGYNIHATSITEEQDSLRLNLSNRSIALLKRDRIIKEAGNKRFIIVTEKTK